MDMSLSKLQKLVDREAWRSDSPWGHKEPDETEPLNNTNKELLIFTFQKDLLKYSIKWDWLLRLNY